MQSVLKILCATVKNLVNQVIRRLALVHTRGWCLNLECLPYYCRYSCFYLVHPDNHGVVSSHRYFPAHRPSRDAEVFQKSRSHFKILGARWVTQDTLHTEDPQISGATVQNLVARATRHLGFVHPWSSLIRHYMISATEGMSLEHFAFCYS